MNPPILFTRRQAADALSVSVYTVSRLIARGELPEVRIGSNVMIPRADVLDLVDRGGAATRIDRLGTRP